MEDIACLIFFGMCLFIPIILDAISSICYNIKTIEVPQYIVVKEYIEDAPIVFNFRNDQKEYKKDKVKQEKSTESQIHQDAVECLISLGMKKSEASKKVSSMMSVKNYSTIEDFLMDVYKK